MPETYQTPPQAEEQEHFRSAPSQAYYMLGHLEELEAPLPRLSSAFVIINGVQWLSSVQL